jgi:hypothetical protein
LVLKRPDEEPAGAERPIGDLVRELIDEGKAYAIAELDVAKAIALAKCKAVALPAGLFAAALILALAAITALAVGVVIALAKFVGPLAAGVIGLLIFGGIAGGCGWYGYERLRRDL